MGTKRTMIAVAVAVAVLVASVFAWDRLRGSGFRWDAFWASLRGMDVTLLALGCAFVLAAYVGRVLRWRVMLRPFGRPAPFRGILSATLIGFTAVVFFGRPGELVRPWLIARRQKVPLSSQLAAWLLERILDLLMVLILFGFALTRLPSGSAAVGPGMKRVLASGGAVALLLGTACVILLIVSALYADVSRRWFGSFSRFLPKTLQGRAVSLYDSFMNGMASTGSASTLGELLAWTVVEWAIIVAGMHFVLRAYPATAGFRVEDTVVFAGFVAFGGAVQLPGIGGGFQVAAILVLTELFGVGLESATAAALVVWAISWLVVVPPGMACAFAEGLKWSSLKHIEDEGVRT